MRRSLEVFAKDIADAERERCAKICEMHAWEWEHSAGHPTEALKEAARKIRD